jgi:hypothetical protein
LFAYVVGGAFIEPDLNNYSWLTQFPSLNTGASDSLTGLTDDWGTYLGYEFVVGNTELLASIDIRAYYWGSPTDNVYIEILSGGRDGTLIGTSSDVPMTSWPFANGGLSIGAFANIPFPTPIALLPGTLYAWIIRRDGPGDWDNYLDVHESKTNPVPGSPARVDPVHHSLIFDSSLGTPAWVESTNYGFEFRLLYSPGIFGPTLQYLLTTATIAAESAVTQPTVTYAVTTAFISSGSTITAPTPIAPGEVVILGETIPSGSALYIPTLTVGDVSVTTGTISATSLFPPNVETPGSIALPTISETVVYAPSTRYLTTAATISSGSSVTAPTIVHVVSAATITSGEVLYNPTVVLIVTISAPTISATIISEPTVTPGAVIVGGAFVSSGEVTYAPTATSFTQLAFIASGAVLSGPAVGNDQQYIELPTISDTLLYPPLDVSSYLFPAPPERNFSVSFEYRVRSVPFENRTFIVPATVRHFAEVG